MSLMTFKQQGDFKKLSSFLERMKKPLKKTTLDKYGKEGVQALMAATPVDTGLTASLWHYDINMSKDSSSISFLREDILDFICFISYRDSFELIDLSLVVFA